MNAYDGPSKNGNFSLRFRTNSWYSPEEILFEYNNPDSVARHHENFSEDVSSIYFQNSVYDLLDD